jgi:ankyrin repeat protein
MAKRQGQMVSIPPSQAQFSEADELTEEDECWTDLQLAAKDGDLAKAQQLIDSGVDINAPAAGYYGNTALQAACLFGHEDIAKLLIERGADVNASGGNNGTSHVMEL